MQILKYRVCFDGARQGHFPEILSLITTFSHTPAIATIFMVCQSQIQYIYQK